MTNEELLKMIMELSHRISQLEVENKNLKRDIESLMKEQKPEIFIYSNKF